jgi:hypothetical protein
MNTSVVSVKTQAASGAVKAGPGALFGVMPLASATGIVTFYDNPSAASGKVLLGPVTLVAGTPVTFDGLGVACAQGIYMNLVSGTCTCNVLYT